AARWHVPGSRGLPMNVPHAISPGAGHGSAVSIAAGRAVLAGDLVVPPDAEAIVLFAHGSGSSRHSRHNRRLAALLQKRGLATLLMDLLTPDERAVDVPTTECRFDINRSAQ